MQFCRVRLADNARLVFSGLGVDTHSNAAALLLFMLVSPVFTIFMQPISAYFQRKFEFEADDFASQNAKPSKMISGLVKLYEENASTLTPDPLYSAFHYSHPRSYSYCPSGNKNALGIMAELHEGLVISHLGQGIAVELSGVIYLCQTRRKLETVTVGDRVMITLSPPNQGRIEQILPRRSLLQRPSRNNKTRPVAANIDKIYIVFAVEPTCDFLLIDQYLAICENKNIDAVLVLNKVDLEREHIEQELQLYEALSYPLHRVSAVQNQGIDELKMALNNHINIFTGQSG